MDLFSLRAGLVLAVGLAASIPGWASPTFTCAANIDAANAGTCAFLNNTINGVASLYDAQFTNATASVYLTYGVTGLGSSTQYYDYRTYTAYYNALIANAVGANDAISNATLGGGANNPVVPGSQIAMTSALITALGLGSGTGIDVTQAACVLGGAGCYNGFITLTNAQPWNYRNSVNNGSQYDFYEVVQHEFNEVLGTSSCLTTVSGAPGLGANCVNATGASDLFRYSAAGTRSFLATANGSLAYFSIDGGVTNIAGYNNSPNGSDYGDWSAGPNRVQNASGSPGVPGVDIANQEIRVLDAIGYKIGAPSAVPEPSTYALFGSGLLLLAGYRRFRA